MVVSFFLMTKLYTLNTSLVSDDSLKFISRERKMKAMRYSYEKDRKLSLASSILISRGLEEYGIDERDIIYAYGKYGKPYFRDYPSIHFNISHSASLAAAVFSDVEVGCDVEVITPYDEDVAAMCFTPRERENIMLSEDRALAFTRLWCIKESFLKATGLGLERGMDSFGVEINDGGIFLEEDIDKKKWKISTSMVDNYFIAVTEEEINE